MTTYGLCRRTALSRQNNKTKSKKKCFVLEALYAFIPYFESKPEYEWGGGKQADGTLQFPFPKYDESMIKFERIFYELNCADTDYQNTIERHCYFVNDDLPNAIEAAPYPLVIAILTVYIR